MNRLSYFLNNFFTPTENNNLRARALHHDFLTFYLALALLFVFFAKTAGGSANNVLGFATDITTQKLYDLTNREREKAGLNDLKYNQTLSKAAYEKAKDMFAQNYWAHYSPDGKTPWDFMYKSGYQYEYAGENLAKNFLFSNNVVDAWMKSPGHRENILKKDYTEIGFAIVNGVLNGEETTLVVQMFGKPLDTGLVVDNKTANVKNAPQPVSVLAEAKSGKAIVSPFHISFNIFWSFIAFLLIVLVSDLYFGLKMSTIRFHGKNLAHIIFIIFISLGFLLFMTKGVIL